MWRSLTGFTPWERGGSNSCARTARFSLLVICALGLMALAASVGADGSLERASGGGGLERRDDGEKKDDGTCRLGLTKCGSQCVDLLSDVSNCAACNRRCVSGIAKALDVCFMGLCEFTCSGSSKPVSCGDGFACLAPGEGCPMEAVGKSNAPDAPAPTVAAAPAPSPAAPAPAAPAQTTAAQGASPPAAAPPTSARAASPITAARAQQSTAANPAVPPATQSSSSSSTNRASIPFNSTVVWNANNPNDFFRGEFWIIELVDTGDSVECNSTTCFIGMMVEADDKPQSSFSLNCPPSISCTNISSFQLMIANTQNCLSSLTLGPTPCIADVTLDNYNDLQSQLWRLDVDTAGYTGTTIRTRYGDPATNCLQHNPNDTTALHLGSCVKAISLWYTVAPDDTTFFTIHAANLTYSKPGARGPPDDSDRTFKLAVTLGTVIPALVIASVAGVYIMRRRTPWKHAHKRVGSRRGGGRGGHGRGRRASAASSDSSDSDSVKSTSGLLRRAPSSGRTRSSRTAVDSDPGLHLEGVPVAGRTAVLEQASMRLVGRVGVPVPGGPGDRSSMRSWSIGASPRVQSLSRSGNGPVAVPHGMRGRPSVEMTMVGAGRPSVESGRGTVMGSVGRNGIAGGNGNGSGRAPGGSRPPSQGGGPPSLVRSVGLDTVQLPQRARDLETASLLGNINRFYIALGGDPLSDQPVMVNRVLVAVSDVEPALTDELELREGVAYHVELLWADGWCFVRNLNTGATGYAPIVAMSSAPAEFIANITAPAVGATNPSPSTGHPATNGTPPSGAEAGSLSRGESRTSVASGTSGSTTAGGSNPQRPSLDRRSTGGSSALSGQIPPRGPSRLNSIRNPNFGDGASPVTPITMANRIPDVGRAGSTGSGTRMGAGTGAGTGGSGGVQVEPARAPVAGEGTTAGSMTATQAAALLSLDGVPIDVDTLDQLLVGRHITREAYVILRGRLLGNP